jgi:dephospho-CoA kinase
MRWIGLTGGIATGKSSATKVLRTLGYNVVDADEVSHAVTAVGSSALPLVFSAFGESVKNSDGGLDRRALGKKVFGQPTEIQKLEAILHPLIRAHVDLEKKKIEASGASVAFYDVPLLFEKKMAHDFEAVILIYASEAQQIERMKNRNGLTFEEAVARLKSQLPIESKRQWTKFVVDNSRDLTWLQSEIVRILRELHIQ